MCFVFIIKGDHSNQLVHQKKATTHTISEGHHVRSVTLDSPSHTPFFYAVRSPEFSTEHIYSLQLPPPESPLTVGLISDSQSNAVVTRNLLKSLVQLHPNLIIHGGDVVQHGYSLHDWQINWLSPLSLLSRPLLGGLHQQIPLIVSRGNHDISPFGDLYGLPFSYFSTSLGETRWVFLDSHQFFDEQVRFLEREVQSDPWKNAKFRIMVTHIPPYIEWWEREAWFEKGEKHWGDAVLQRFLPVLEAAQVDLVIGGHSHLYSRGWQRGVHYLVIGGGGGDLEKERVEDFKIFKVNALAYHFALMEVSARGCYLQWNVYDDQGNNIDTLKILSKACT